MKGLHDGRPLWGLVKELVANVWDEPTATECTVSISPVEWASIAKGAESITVSVKDNGAGFARVTDAFTLMAPTDKRTDSKTRGRFNIGEKEIISIATHAKIETVGTTVNFPKEGGRVVGKNKRKKGTIVTAVVERPHDEIEETVARLLEFLPPADKAYTVNGETVPTPKKIATVSNRDLPTIISKGANEPLRNGWRTCEVDIHEPIRGVGRIYEMGILIQEIEAPYSVDIQQKVPMPPNRDTVTQTYLQDVYSIVLGAIAKDLDGAEASEAWVQMGVEDSKTTDETVGIVMSAKLGDNAVLWSSDTQSNERAYEAGKDVVHPRTLSKKEKERFQKAGLASSTAEFKLLTNTDEGIKFETLAKKPEWKNVEEYTKWLSFKLLGFEGTVNFISPKMVGDNRIAQYGGKTLDFVPQRLGKAFFQMDQAKPTPQQTELILHELAHHNPSDRPHTGDYLHTFAELSAKAVHLALEGDWFVGQGS